MGASETLVNDEPAAKPGCMLGIIFGAIIGGSCAALVLTSGFNVSWNLKSTDFVSAVLSALGVLLAAISVLLALLGLAIAVGAIYGWKEFKSRTGKMAAEKAAAIAGPAAIEVAVPAAIKQVDIYLDKNLDPEIRQKVISIVGQIVTPEFIRGVVQQGKEPDVEPTKSNLASPLFPAGAIQAAATEEVNKQEESLDAFDATVAAEEMRGGNQPGEDDV